MAGAAYWPFWMGGAGLGAVAVLHLLWTRHPLGLSGSLARLLRPRADERDRKAELALAAGDLDAALLAATLARFGPAAAEAVSQNPDLDSAPREGENQTDGAGGAGRASRMPVDCGALFVACLVLGGVLAQGSSSNVSAASAASASSELGAGFDRLAGLGLGDALQLLVGGLLVGFGARMAGGCTSGHGLSGLASFRPASALATAAMFAGGIAASLWLER